MSHTRYGSEARSSCGLAGSHLKLKMTIFWYFYDLLMSEPSFVSVAADPGAQAHPTKVGRFKTWAMKKILELINSVLGSLARVLSISDIIKEFKEMAEHGYDLGEPGS